MSWIAKRLLRLSGGQSPMRWWRTTSRIQIEQEIARLQARPCRIDHPGRLTAFEHKVFSQFGEDGVLAEIFRRLGRTNSFFIEIGVGDGLENNTAYLLQTGWRGLWIEMDPECIRNIRLHTKFKLDTKELTLLTTPATPDNIERLFQSASVPTEPDLLSIDIDGKDYEVWRAIHHYRPRVVAIEYNASFPPQQRWRQAESSHGQYFTTCSGASLASLTDLARAKGYELVGCVLAGSNAFFVRSDLAHTGKFASPFTAENHYEPPRYHLYFPALGHPASLGPGITD